MWRGINKNPLFLPCSYKALLYLGLWTTSYSRKPEYNPVISLQKRDVSINQIFLLLNPIFNFNICEQLQQLKRRQHRVSDGSLWFLFSMYSFISLLYLTIFFVSVILISAANPKRLWRPWVGIDQFESHKTTFYRIWANRYKAQYRKKYGAQKCNKSTTAYF